MEFHAAQDKPDDEITAVYSPVFLLGVPFSGFRKILLRNIHHRIAMLLHGTFTSQKDTEAAPHKTRTAATPNIDNVPGM